MRRISILLGIALAYCLPLLCVAEDKPAAPELAVQQQELRAVDRVFKNDLIKATTAKQKVELARKMLVNAAENPGEPAVQFALMVKARELAIQAMDVEMAYEAIARLDTQFQSDPMKSKSDVLVAISRNLRGSDGQRALVYQCNTLIDELIAVDRYDVAGRIAELAVAAARMSGDADLRQSVSSRPLEVRQCETAFAKAKAAIATLAKTPDDPDANLVVGRFRCFMKGDWNHGLSLLALGADPGLKTLAQQELAGPTPGDAEVAVGDSWWGVAKKEGKFSQDRIREHAANWYRQALPALSGLARIRVEKRLAEIITNPDDALVSLKQIVKTRRLGGGGDDNFDYAPTPPSYLLGFNTTVGQFNQTFHIITSIQPIYRDGEKKPAPIYGHGTGSSTKVVAKDGYAVGGVVMKVGAKVDGFKIVFMRIKRGGLDPTDSYESEWLGGKGGSGEIKLACNGNPVIGIHGRHDQTLDAFGLVQLSKEAAAPQAEK